MQFYRKAFLSAFAGQINFTNDTLKATLHTSTYTPNLDTDQYVSNLAGELSTGGGYTSGGVTVSPGTAAYTAAANWGASWSATTAISAQYLIKATSTIDSKTYLFRAVAAGTTGGSAPTWTNVVGVDVTDGSVTWENVGGGVTVLQLAANPSWANATFANARYLVLSDRTPVSTSAQPLIALHDFGSNQSGQGGTFTDVMDPQGTLQIFHP